MATPQSVLELIERFDRNRNAYRSEQYNEARLRIEFLNPFFEGLGWDVSNKQGYAEAYKDVIYEDAIKIGTATKAPDYCFRIGGTRKFFVEAKKPAVNLKNASEPAFQLRRYAWSAKLPLSILTDFEEFAIYDCRVKPDRDDNATTARIMYLTFTDYPQHWEELVSIFSREAILKGSFDTYAEATKGKRGTAEVDTAFLQEIESWREMLAQHLALRNKKLTQRELNFAVQMTIDRLIFLRICEDRGIEEYERLRALLKGTKVYERLCNLFLQADERYNSGLFHFQKEKNAPEPPDTLTLSLVLDDRPLKNIITRLYYPDSPYEFSVLPADVLGKVYEQFLGKVIRLTPSHQVMVEEKPEVRKAGGVYYTPTFIVDYIVRHTLSKLLEGKKPGPKGSASKIKIVDPACGSGSFLIVAYQHLLDWHRDRYVENGPEKHRKELYQGPGGLWLLTTQEKKRILLNSIYGVDIDPQAVEVTKLSLLLKVLEGESNQSLVAQLSLFKERALPDLDRNIKCGNSLISPDFYDIAQMSFYDEEERYRINVFDWGAEFPEIISSGGFDVVIGNPPYVFGRDWKALDISDTVKKYLGRIYKSSPYQLDMFSIFMEKAYQLCKLSGYVGQIVPNVWLSNTYSAKTRQFVLSHAHELCITVPPSHVFPKLTVDTVVYTLKKEADPDEFFLVNALHTGDVAEIATYRTKQYLDGQQPISTSVGSKSTELVFRLKKAFPELRTFADITRGVHSYRIGGYGQTAYGLGHQTERDCQERPYHSKSFKEGYQPFIYGRNLCRFMLPKPTEFVKYGPWLAEPRKPEFFQGSRIYSRKILGERLVVTLETTDSIADQQVYITKPKTDMLSAAYLVGVLGSLLMAFFIRVYYDEVNDLFPQIKVGQLQSLPIPAISNIDMRTKHDLMVELVERILALHKQLATVKTSQEKIAIQRQIDTTDRQIEKLVYELYGLTEEEIKIVEEKLQD